MCEILLARGTEHLIQGTVCKASVKQKWKKHQFRDFPRTTRKKQKWFIITNQSSFAEIQYKGNNKREILNGRFDQIERISRKL